MKKQIKTLFFISLIYLFVNFLFNFTVWKDIIYPQKNNVLALYGESTTYEIVAEIVRKNIISGQNPFTTYNNIFYPEGWNFVLDDIAPFNGFIFLFTRLFLNMHQSLMLIVVASILLSNLSMYWLLRVLKFNKIISFFGGLIYGFTPFISLRIAHPNYTTLYFFPLIASLIILIGKSKEKNRKIFFSIILGISSSALVLTNLYYTVMIFLALIIFGSMLIIFERKLFIKYFIKEIKYFFLSIIIFIIFLLPWLIKVYELLRFNSYDTITSLANYIPYSADLLNIIVPSKANPLYKIILKNLYAYVPYIKNIFENFIYPGVIILIGLTITLFSWKKLPKIIKIVFLVSTIFLIFTFGPYFKILGKVTSIRLPYYYLYKLPLIQMARAPGRFVVPFVFFATLTTAYVFKRLTDNMAEGKRRLLMIFLLTVFFIDQIYFIVPQKSILLPKNIYTYLSVNNSGPVLNIPYTIRDGLRFLGYKNVVWHPYSSFIHEQPLYGNYAGRIDEDIFLYYERDPLFGFLHKIINGNTKDYKTLLDEVNYNDLEKSIDFFNINNIVLKKDELYSKEVINIVQKLGFTKIITDNEYILYQRNKKENKEFIKINVKSKKDEYYFYEGWYNAEPEGRWTHGNISKIFFKINRIRPMKVKLKVSTIKNIEKTEIYLNNQYLKTITILPGQINNFEVELGSSLKLGFNQIIFKSLKSYLLGNLTNNLNDSREVSVFIKNIQIVNK